MYITVLCAQNKVTSMAFLCGKSVEDLCRIKQVGNRLHYNKLSFTLAAWFYNFDQGLW